METTKETRIISSDEIFYAVLKDGTVVSISPTRTA